MDDPSRADDAVEYARAQATVVAAWAFGGAPLPTTDARIATFPTEPVEADLIQVGTRDELGAKVQGVSYHSTHYIATPAETRRRIEDVAEFLRGIG